MAVISEVIPKGGPGRIDYLKTGDSGSFVLATHTVPNTDSVGLMKHSPERSVGFIVRGNKSVTTATTKRSGGVVNVEIHEHEGRKINKIKGRNEKGERTRLKYKSDLRLFVERKTVEIFNAYISLERPYPFPPFF